MPASADNCCHLSTPPDGLATARQKVVRVIRGMMNLDYYSGGFWGEGWGRSFSTLWHSVIFWYFDHRCIYFWVWVMIGRWVSNKLGYVPSVWIMTVYKHGLTNTIVQHRAVTFICYATRTCVLYKNILGRWLRTVIFIEEGTGAARGGARGAGAPRANLLSLRA